MKAMRYVVVGDVGWDTILELDEQHPDLCHLEGNELRLAAGQKVIARRSHQSLGGNAANVALALDRLSASVRLISHVGRDWTGRQILHHIDEAGVSTTDISRAADGSNHATILLCEGERTIVSYHAEGPYKLDKVRDDDWLLLCSMGEAGERLSDQALALDRPFIYLPGTRQIRGSRQRNRRLIKQAEMLILNFEEAQAISDEMVRDPVIMARRLLDWGVKEVIVTLGRQGAVAAHDSGIWRSGIWHRGARRDPTGAGDAFAATYIFERLSGEDVETSLRLATVNAGSVVGEFGSTAGLLTRPRLLKLLRQESVSVRREAYER